ncbi:MAG: hypothetical protein AAF552_09715, partial [Pseudomonadota bacterium]
KEIGVDEVSNENQVGLAITIKITCENGSVLVKRTGFETTFTIENDLIKLDSVRSAPPDWPATHIENSCQWVEFDLFANQSITSLPVHFCGHYAYEYPKWLGMPEGKGHLSGFWDGKKVNSPAELPREMLNRMEREYPELLKPRWDEFDRPIPFEV